MVTDGREFEHGAARKGVWKKATHYDQVWKALDGSGLRMVGDHSKRGGTFRLIDAAQVKVGEVTFGSLDDFRAGQFYGDFYVAGRVHNANQAVAEFILRIEETHAKRQ